MEISKVVTTSIPQIDNMSCICHESTKNEHMTITNLLPTQHDYSEHDITLACQPDQQSDALRKRKTEF